MEKLLKILQTELFNIRIIFAGQLIEEDRHITELKINITDPVAIDMNCDRVNLHKDRITVLRHYKKAFSEKKTQVDQKVKSPEPCL